MCYSLCRGSLHCITQKGNARLTVDNQMFPNILFESSLDFEVMQYLNCLPCIDCCDIHTCKLAWKFAGQFCPSSSALDPDRTNSCYNPRNAESPTSSQSPPAFREEICCHSSLCRELLDCSLLVFAWHGLPIKCSQASN